MPPAEPEVPAFTVPTISHLKKRAFLAAFAESGNVRLASAAAGIISAEPSEQGGNRAWSAGDPVQARHQRQPRRASHTHTNWRQDDEAYAAAFMLAKEHAADRLEQESPGGAPGRASSNPCISGAARLAERPAPTAVSAVS